MNLTKKVKYILLALTILILSIVIPNISKAWNPDLAGRFDEPDLGNYFWVSENTLLDQIKNSSSRYTQKINIRFAMLYDRTDLHCLQHNYSMIGWQTYENTMYIEINGNTARNPETGATVTSTYNGRLAYILSKDQNYGPLAPDNYWYENRGERDGYSDVQKSLWGIMNEWYANVGKYLGIDWTFPANDDASFKNNQLYKDAITYANSIGSGNSGGSVATKDNTNKANIKVEYYTGSDGVTYEKVGPFNWTFGGSLNTVTLTGNNGQSPSLKIFASNGTTEISANQIVSGQDFYVAFRADSGINTISKLEGSGSVSSTGIISAKLWFLYRYRSDEAQRLLLSNHSTQPSTTNFTVKTENITLTINFSVVKVDEDDNSIKLPNVGFKFYNKDSGKYIKMNGNTVQYVDTIEEATEFLTDENGQISLNNVLAGTYMAYETKNPNRGYDVVDEPIEINPTNDATIAIGNELKYVVIEVIKVDKNNNTIKLEGVGFKFYNEDDGKYLKVDENNEFVEYVDTMEEATEVKTDNEGKIKLNYVPKGTYLAYEISNPNYGYVAGGEPYEIEAPRDTNVELGNEIKYIKITGLVWEDIQSEKMSVRNDLYNLDENDDADILMEGVKVSLKDRTTGDLVDDTIEGLDPDQRVVAETYTDENGEYQFDYVPVDNLENYYVEFEYDGLIYENVIPHLENEEKGSKAAEPGRDDFNNRFNSMDKGSSDMQTIADQNGNTSERPIVNYDIAETGEGGRLLEMTSTENTEIIATTDEAGYTIEYDETEATAEVTNINLGLYKRPQTDLALQTEIEEIKAEINGYGHIYRYGPKYDVNNAQEVEDSWNLGVRFENTYKGTYERPIYKADAAYENTEDPSKELRLSLTYKITIRNQGSVYGKVNKVIAYFDSRYDQITAIGTEMDNEGNVVGTPLTIGQSQDEGNGYRRVEIDTSVLNQIIDYPTANAEERESEQNIYVQFNLPREVILEMLNEEEVDNTLSFTAEIGSYASYSDPEGNTLYAAYDLDSVPDNATVGEFSTYEDDTDRASEVAITLAGARTISGYVFEDTKEESQENVAEGNGRKDDDETNLKGVTVELIDVTNDSVTQIYDSNTDVWANASYPVDETNGNYVIAGFIPGQYLIRFTWGDGTERIVEPDNAEEITVENYKSTIISYDKYQAYQELQNQGNAGRFYKDETIVDGSSLALDNQEIRQQIDDDLKEYKYDTDSDITEIPADTWEMDFPIEYDADELLSATLEATTDAREDTNDENNEHRITFPVSNINFGIIRRPEQNIELTKTVTAFRFILPTGQTLIDATVNDDGTISGTTNYLSYIGNKQNPEGSVLRAEVDENLIQGSSVEIKYKLTVRNTSEVDYLNENYYNYGEEYYRVSGEARKTSEVVTFTPTSIIDYLDENSQFNDNSAVNSTYNWTNISIEDANIAQNVKDALKSQLDNYQLYISRTFEEQSIILRPVFYVNGVQVDNSGNTASAEIEEGQPVASSQGANYQNQAEIIEVVKTGGGKLTSTPGNYIPNKTSDETPDTDDTTSEEVVIIPSTGGNRNYVLPISLMVIALITLGVGVYVIKVKVLGKK